MFLFEILGCNTGVVNFNKIAVKSHRLGDERSNAQSFSLKR